MSTIPKFEFIDVTSSLTNAVENSEQNNEIKVTSINRYAFIISIINP